MDQLQVLNHVVGRVAAYTPIANFDTKLVVVTAVYALILPTSPWG